MNSKWNHLMEVAEAGWPYDAALEDRVFEKLAKAAGKRSPSDLNEMDIIPIVSKSSMMLSQFSQQLFIDFFKYKYRKDPALPRTWMGTVASLSRLMIGNNPYQASRVRTPSGVRAVMRHILVSIDLELE